MDSESNFYGAPQRHTYPKQRKHTARNMMILLVILFVVTVFVL